MDVKIKQIVKWQQWLAYNVMVIVLVVYYGELTRMHQVKFTSLEAQSQVFNMVELARKELWSCKSNK